MYKIILHRTKPGSPGLTSNKLEKGTEEDYPYSPTGQLVGGVVEWKNLAPDVCSLLHG